MVSSLVTVFLVRLEGQRHLILCWSRQASWSELYPAQLVGRQDPSWRKGMFMPLCLGRRKLPQCALWICAPDRGLRIAGRSMAQN